MPYILLILALCSHLTVAAPLIRLASGEWPPYAGSHLPAGGFAEQIIRAALHEQGRAVEFVRLPWKRGKEMARTGHLDGTILWSDNPVFYKDFIISSPFIRSEVTLFWRQGLHLDLNNPNHLKTIRIGYPLGYGYEKSPRLKAWIASAKIAPITVDNDEQGIRALLHGRIDFYPIDRQVAHYLLKQITGGQGQLMEDKQAWQLDDLCVLFSRQSQHAQQNLLDFEAGLLKLKTSGRFNAILKSSHSVPAPVLQQ